jgi:hypothetical protein
VTSFATESLRLRNQAAHSAESALAVSDAKQMIEMRFKDLFRAFDVKVIVLFPGDQTNKFGHVLESPKVPGDDRVR